MNAVSVVWIIFVVAWGNVEQRHLARLVEAAKQIKTGDNEATVLNLLGRPLAEYPANPGWSPLKIGSRPREWCYGTIVDRRRILLVDSPIIINPFPLHIRLLGYADDDLVIGWEATGKVKTVEYPVISHDVDERFDSLLDLVYAFSKVRRTLKTTGSAHPCGIHV